MNKLVRESPSRDRHPAQQRDRIYEQEIVRQQTRIAELEAQMQHLHKELSRQQGVKQQVKSLYLSLDGWILRQIDSRGYTRNTRLKQVEFPHLDLLAADRAELLAVARAYDVKNYFQYRERRTSMKLRYRLAGKSYRTSRDISKTGLKKVYRLTRRAKV